MADITVGSVDQTIDVYVAKTDGTAMTDLMYNTAGLACYYRIGPTGTATQLVLATQTVNGAHSDGGFCAVSSGLMPGVYRLDISDNIVAQTGWAHLILYGATNMVPTPVRIDCKPKNSQVSSVTDSATNYIADGVLKRDFSSVTGEASRSLLNSLRFIRNNWYINNDVLYITKEDDVTVAWSGAVSAGNGSGVSSMNPY